MSRITEVIVCFFASKEEVDKRIYEVNLIVEGVRHSPFKRVDQFAGGEKIFCGCVLLGCFNHFCFEYFIREMKKLFWDEFYYAWVMQKDEASDVWDGPMELKEIRSVDKAFILPERLEEKCSPDKVVSGPYEVKDL